MFGSNAHYGHRSILNRHGGVPQGHPIPGLVQHGWNYDLGATLQDILLPKPEPFFIWSERNLRQCKKAGIGGLVKPLGSPFLYLPPLAPHDLEGAKTEPGSLLVMPIHGWEKERISQDFHEYAAHTAELRRDFKKITVCLYWFDFQFEQYRKPWEALGFDVITAGPRDRNPGFLHDLRRLMLRFEYVSSNRVQTSAFYALSLGRKFFLHGPPIGLDGRFDHSGQLFHAWQTMEYPTLRWETFKDVCHRDIGDEELGIGFRREPEALRELFSWTPQQARELDRKQRDKRDRERRKRWETRAEELRSKVARWLPLLQKRTSKEDTRP